MEVNAYNDINGRQHRLNAEASEHNCAPDKQSCVRLKIWVVQNPETGSSRNAEKNAQKRSRS